jgi:uncharacterized protein (TIGR02246 family)
MKKLTQIFTLLCVLSLAGCEPKSVDTAAEGEKLMQASREWSKSASARDIEKALSYWADDAIVISAGEPELKGKNAIRGMVEGGLKDPNFNISWEPQSVEISKSGDMGYLLEDAIITMKDSTGNSASQHFRSVTIWKKQADGSWKNVVDVLSPKAVDQPVN